MGPDLRHNARRYVATASCALAALLAPAAAHAATASVDNGRLTYTGGTEANQLVVTAAGSTVQLSDAGTGVAISAGARCSGGGSQVTCTGVSSMRLNVGEGANTVDARAVALGTTVAAGGGADRIETGTSLDSITAGGGADWLDAGPGRDLFNAGGGDDVVIARDGEVDGIGCGSGTDSGTDDEADYTSSDCEALGDLPPGGPPAPGGGDPEPEPGNGTGTGDGSGNAGTDPGTNPPGNGDGGGDLTGPLNLEPAVVFAQTAPVVGGVAQVRIGCPADAGGCKGTVDIFLPNRGAKAGAKAAAKSAIGAARRGKPSRRTKPARKRVRIGRAKFSARAGTKPTVKVRLDRRGRRRVTRRRKVRATVVVTTRTATGQIFTDTQAITLSRRGKGRR
jgi:hypothetical protein